MSVFDLYRDPIYIDWNDVNEEITETIKVYQGKAVLSQIPDEFQKVQITNYIETTVSIPAQATHFYVNYTTGILNLHTSVADGTSLTAHYFGRGQIRYPASRIYAFDENNNVQETLQAIIDRTDTKTTNFEHKGNYLSTQTYYPNNIVYYNNSTYMCILESINNLPTNTTYFKSVADMTSIIDAEASRVSAESNRITSENNRISTESSRVSAESSRVSNEATRVSQENQRQSAYNSSLMIWQSPVANYAAIASTYSTPSYAWCCQTLDDNSVYRWDSTQWKYFGKFNLSGAATQTNLNSEDIARADILRQTAHSGVLDFQENIINLADAGQPYGQIQVPTVSQAGLYNYYNVVGMKAFNALINGYKTFVINSNDPNMAGVWAEYNHIGFNSPPTSGTRDDLVFLEGYFSNSNTTGTMSWRIRVVDGVDFTTYSMDGFTKDVNTINNGDFNILVLPQGGNASPVVYDYNTNYAYFTNQKQRRAYPTNYPVALEDTGLYTAGDGSNAAKTALSTVDGYSYAIPLFRIKRRNNAGYSKANPNGGRDYCDVVITYGARTAGLPMDVTVNSGLSKIQVGDILFYLTESARYFKVIAINGSILRCISYVTGAGGTNEGGWGIVSGRPDGLYSNIIDVNDIIDLRHKTYLLSPDFQSLCEENFDKLLRGELLTKDKIKLANDYLGCEQGANITSGLVLDIDFSELANDKSGNKNHGNITGATRVTTPTGYGYSFDGSDDKIVVPINDTLKFGTGNFTLEALIYIDSTGSNIWQRILGSKPTNGIAQGYSLYWHGGSGKFMFSTANGSAAQETYTIQTFEKNRWYHVFMVREDADVNNAYFYINNVKYPLDSAMSMLDVSGTNDFSLGLIHDDGSLPFKGIIAFARAYNRALSVAEINSRYSLFTDFVSGDAQLFSAPEQLRRSKSDALTSQTTTQVISPIKKQVLDFSNLGTYHKAYEGEASSIFTPSTLPGEFDSTEYGQIISKDDTTKSTVTATTGNYAQQISVFDLTKLGGNAAGITSALSKLKFGWTGRAQGDNSGAASYSMNVSVWDKTLNTGAGGWALTAYVETASGWPSDSIPAELTITSDLANYVDSNGKVWFIVKSTFPAGTNSDSKLYTDTAGLYCELDKWAAGRIIDIESVEGIVSGVIDSDTALATIITDGDSGSGYTLTAAVNDVSKLAVNDYVSVYRGSSSAPILLKITAISGLNVTFDSTTTFYGTFALISGWFIVETTASTSVPAVTATGVEGTWSNLGTKKATYTISTAPTTNTDSISIQYSLNYPAGQGLTYVPSEVKDVVNAGAGIKVKGKTLVNLLGKDGNFEDGISGWSGNGATSATDKYLYGGKSLKLTGPLNELYVAKDFNVTDSSKYYILLADAQITRFVNFEPCLVLYDYNDWTNSIVTSFNTSSLNVWQTRYLKFTNRTGIRVLLGNYSGGTDFDIYFDGARLYEIDQTTYNKIDVDPEYTGEKLAQKFPYVDSVQHKTGVLLTQIGKNLIPSFNSGEWNLHANTVVNSDYSLTLNANGAYQYSALEINCLPNTVYVIKATSVFVSGMFFTVKLYDNNGVQIGSNIDSVGGLFMIVAPTNACKLVLFLQSEASGTFTFTNPQLELARYSIIQSAGSLTVIPVDDVSKFAVNDTVYVLTKSTNTLSSSATVSSIDTTNKTVTISAARTCVAGDYLVSGMPTTFEPQVKSLAHTPLSLATDDEVYLMPGNAAYKEVWKKNVTLDGSLTYAFSADFTGHKVVGVSTIPGTNLSEIVVKYDGTILGKERTDTWVVSDVAQLWSNVLLLSISDTNSGWTDTMNPSADEIKAYFYGWKMCAVDGTTYVSGTKYWKKITDGTGITATLPTASYDGYTPYKLHYKLANPVYHVNYVDDDPTKPVMSPGSIVNIPSGITQVEEKSGVQWRELKQPYFYVTTYYLNDKDIANSYLSYRTKDILSIRENDLSAITKFTVVGSTAYGLKRATILPKNYDPAAIYSVTYEMLDKYNYTPDFGTIITNPTHTPAYSFQDIDIQGHHDVGYFSFLSSLFDTTTVECKQISLKSDSTHKTGLGSIRGFNVLYKYVPYQGVGCVNASCKVVYMPNKVFIHTYGTGKSPSSTDVGNLSKWYNSPISVNLPLGTSVKDYQLRIGDIATKLFGIGDYMKAYGYLTITGDQGYDNVHKIPRTGELIYLGGSTFTRGFSGVYATGSGLIVFANNEQIPEKTEIVMSLLVQYNSRLYLLISTSMMDNFSGSALFDGNTFTASDIYELPGRPLLKI